MHGRLSGESLVIEHARQHPHAVLVDRIQRDRAALVVDERIREAPDDVLRVSPALVLKVLVLVKPLRSQRRQNLPEQAGVKMPPRPLVREAVADRPDAERQSVWYQARVRAVQQADLQFSVFVEPLELHVEVLEPGHPRVGRHSLDHPEMEILARVDEMVLIRQTKFVLRRGLSRNYPVDESVAEPALASDIALESLTEAPLAPVPQDKRSELSGVVLYKLAREHEEAAKPLVHPPLYQSREPCRIAARAVGSLAVLPRDSGLGGIGDYPDSLRVVGEPQETLVVVLRVDAAGDAVDERYVLMLLVARGVRVHIVLRGERVFVGLRADDEDILVGYPRLVVLRDHNVVESAQENAAAELYRPDRTVFSSEL